jgi:hydrogenase maturation factor
MVGDHAFDIEAGVRAGALTMFLWNDADQPGPTAPVESDFVVKDLSEARRVMRCGLPLPLGKLPVKFLRENLALLGDEDASVLVGAGVGEDAAVVDVAGEEVLVLASDPVTLASDSIARYLVLANANDVAACGASPRWFLSTLMFPPGTSASEVRALMCDIRTMCAAWGLTLCGGHTEITQAVASPLAVGVAAGTALRSQVIDKKRMREGDRLLLTKGLAIEGTGLIAREFGGRLTRAGIPAAVVTECADFLDRISVLDDARIAVTFAGVSALHDVTEGGLATAVLELSAAGGCRLRVHMERIPVYPHTERLCEALGLDPLGLLGSGALLIACSPDDAGRLGEALRTAGIEATEIGEVVGAGQGVEALRNGLGVEWPEFDRDEMTRLKG